MGHEDTGLSISNCNGPMPVITGVQYAGCHGTHLLQVIEYPTVIFSEEADGHTGLTGSTSSANAMGVVLYGLSHVIVDNMRDIPEWSGSVG